MSSKQYIAIGVIAGFLLCLFTMQTIHSFNVSDDKLQSKKNFAFKKYFSENIPDEWGGGKTDPYTYSRLDGAPQEEEKAQSNNNDPTKKEKNDYEKHYQITREELGNSGWMILHMISATYPIDVTPEFVEKTNLFLNLFGQFYPCKECSQHFLQMTSKKQFKGQGREDFMMYMCELHNIVNARLGKKIFDCATELEPKWGGNCGCSSKSGPPQEITSDPKI